MATYISLDNLARYDMKAKARAEGLYADASAACWQKTEKAGAVTCVPAPETPLEPVVEFLFTETLPTGTKGPGNPSVIEGVTEIKVTRGAKNLFFIEDYDNSKTAYGLTWTVREDGTVVVSGTATANATFYVARSGKRTLPPGTYTFLCEPGMTNVCDCRLTVGTKNIYAKNYSITFTTTSYESYLCRFYVMSGSTLNNYEFHPLLELGSASTVFERGNGSEYSASLPSTYYGGTLDVASGRLAVTHRMVEPSSGTVDISGLPALLPLEYTDTYGRTVTSDGNTLSVGSSGGQIVYRLANPYTVYVDPVSIDSLPALGRTSPRVNTIYTDALNVQVGYAEHPAYTEELINNAIFALGGDISWHSLFTTSL